MDPLKQRQEAIKSSVRHWLVKQEVITKQLELDTEELMQRSNEMALELDRLRVTNAQHAALISHLKAKLEAVNEAYDLLLRK